MKGSFHLETTWMLVASNGEIFKIDHTVSNGVLAVAIQVGITGNGLEVDKGCQTF